MINNDLTFIIGMGNFSKLLCSYVILSKNKLLCLKLFEFVEDGEGGAVGVFEGEGDEAAVGFELGDLVVIAVLGHVGPGT